MITERDLRPAPGTSPKLAPKSGPDPASAGPSAELDPDSLLAMQRLVGNQAVGELAGLAGEPPDVPVDGVRLDEGGDGAGGAGDDAAGASGGDGADSGAGTGGDAGFVSGATSGEGAKGDGGATSEGGAKGEGGAQGDGSGVSGAEVGGPKAAGAGGGAKNGADPAAASATEAAGAKAEAAAEAAVAKADAASAGAKGAADGLRGAKGSPPGGKAAEAQASGARAVGGPDSGARQSGAKADGGKADGAKAVTSAGAKGGVAAGGSATPGGAGGPSAAAPAGGADLTSVNEELAIHQQWARGPGSGPAPSGGGPTSGEGPGTGAPDVGAAGSDARAAFLADSAGAGLLNGMGQGFQQGFVMGLGMGLLEHAVPIPGLGLVIGGAMALHGIIENWGTTTAAIGAMGTGASIYEELANDLAGLGAIIDLICQILNVIGGIAGAIAIVMWIITMATLGAASPLAATISTIAGLALLGVGIFNALAQSVIQPCVALFRAMHAFTMEASPAAVAAQGAKISAATGIMGGQIGGLAGAIAGGATAKGLAGKPPPAVEPPPMPPPAEGPPARVAFEPPVVTGEGPVSGTAPTVEVPVSGTAPTVEVPVSGTAPTVEVPVSGTAPTVPGEVPVGPVEPLPGQRNPVQQMTAVNPAEVSPGAPQPPGFQSGPVGSFEAPTGSGGVPEPLPGQRNPVQIWENSAAPGKNNVQIWENILDRPGGAPVAETPVSGGSGGPAPGVPVEAPVSGTAPTVPGEGFGTQPTVPGEGFGTQPTVPGEGFGTQPTVPGEVLGPSPAETPTPASTPEPSPSSRPAPAGPETMPAPPDADLPFNPTEVPEPGPGVPGPEIPRPPRLPNIPELPDWGRDPDFRPNPQGPLPDSPYGPTERPPAPGGPAPSGPEPGGPGGPGAPAGPGGPRAGPENLPPATSDNFYELPGQNPATGEGLQTVDVYGRGDPARIMHHDNLGFKGVGEVTVADPAAVPGGGPAEPGGSLIPAGEGTAVEVPVYGKGSPLEGQPRPVEVRTHGPNPAAAKYGPDTYSANNATTQINTNKGAYLDPSTGTFGPPNAEAHMPAGSRYGPGGPKGAPGDYSLYAERPTPGGPIHEIYGRPGVDTLPEGMPQDADVILDPSRYAGPKGGGQGPQGGGPGPQGGAPPGGGPGTPPDGLPPGIAPQVAVDPASGKGVEVVQPNYKNPPGTPQQIAAIQAEIGILAQERASAKAAEAVHGALESEHQKFGGDVAKANDVTAAAAAGAKGHQGEVTQKEANNAQQAAKHGESQGLIKSYPDRAAGIAVMRTPLDVFRGFTHYAGMLPGAVGAKFHQMNGEANRFTAALDRITAQMAAQALQGPAQLVGLQQDKAQLAGVRADSAASEQVFTQQNTEAQTLKAMNDKKLALHATEKQRAADQGAKTDGEINRKETASADLAGRLQTWSAEHRAERQRATEAAKTAYDARGYRTTVETG
ncbi:hypothetical protein GCM10022204_17380 [Microlunatus aurantiacus]|uniref:Uncharacterized protein n=2 Tax=Microlunatus aurantiacus TaxID=446786 RepID=A0ABP7D8J1_9ACTN